MQVDDVDGYSYEPSLASTASSSQASIWSAGSVSSSIASSVSVRICRKTPEYVEVAWRGVKIEAHVLRKSRGKSTVDGSLDADPQSSGTA